ncbi:hypothetical protein [Parasphingorhabdus cellanae]|uniref:Cytochrome c domain-containing protein n=1 Tax=Parasphingorhabdus cellanae TaxID=2806553 RepID=A0ABX7T9C5_9SPHN|nr:hypothetical protein [Parasphingorhabdus cellanae]QTD56862.1 hypothetical protein J4G78_04610 [Parasphingorhabdus cellanae]
MDWRSVRFLKYSAVIGLTCAAVAQAADRPLIQAIEWLDPAQHLAALTTEPRRVAAAKDQQMLAGEALFHTPTLLGGQAAKAGLSCASCHENGRDNPAFLFPNVSGEPGTADVTSSFFSSHRGNGIFDPVKIPDLTVPGKVSRAEDSQELEKFIRDLIVEEFNGQEPTPSVLGALTHYVRSLSADTDNDRVAVTAENQLVAVDQAVLSAKEARQDNDLKLSHLLLASARNRLGLIHERYAGKSLTRQRKAIMSASRELGELQDIEDNADFIVALEEWESGFQRTRKLVVAKQHMSLYDPKLLKAALSQNAN